MQFWQKTCYDMKSLGERITFQPKNVFIETYTTQYKKD